MGKPMYMRLMMGDKKCLIILDSKLLNFHSLWFFPPLSFRRSPCRIKLRELDCTNIAFCLHTFAWNNQRPIKFLSCDIGSWEHKQGKGIKGTSPLSLNASIVYLNQIKPLYRLHCQTPPLIKIILDYKRNTPNYQMKGTSTSTWCSVHRPRQM